jgi:hypothetical protein
VASQEVLKPTLAPRPGGRAALIRAPSPGKKVTVSSPGGGRAPHPARVLPRGGATRPSPFMATSRSHVPGASPEAHTSSSPGWRSAGPGPGWGAPCTWPPRSPPSRIVAGRTSRAWGPRGSASSGAVADRGRPPGGRGSTAWPPGRAPSWTQISGGEPAGQGDDLMRQGGRAYTGERVWASRTRCGSDGPWLPAIGLWRSRSEARSGQAKRVECGRAGGQAFRGVGTTLLDREEGAGGGVFRTHRAAPARPGHRRERPASGARGSPTRSATRAFLDRADPAGSWNGRAGALPESSAR